jgi:hypothetical protein
MSAPIVVNNPLRKAINLEKTRKRINTNIEQLTRNFQKERQYLVNNPGGLPDMLRAAHRRMLSYNARIAELKRTRNNLHGGRKRKTRRK